jgi:hypothetical protein
MQRKKSAEIYAADFELPDARWTGYPIVIHPLTLQYLPVRSAFLISATCESDEVPAADLPICARQVPLDPRRLFNIYRGTSINQDAAGALQIAGGLAVPSQPTLVGHKYSLHGPRGAKRKGRFAAPYLPHRHDRVLHPHRGCV